MQGKPEKEGISVDTNRRVEVHSKVDERELGRTYGRRCLKRSEAVCRLPHTGLRAPWSWTSQSESWFTKNSV